MYAKHFKQTLLAANDDFAFQGEEIIDYARAKGMTLRDDSICVQPPPKSYFHADMAPAFWPTLPVILEHQHYGACKNRGTWRPEKVAASVEAYHASFMSIHGFPKPYLAENRQMIDRINMRMGYRLQPVSVTWPQSIHIGSTQASYAQYGDIAKHGHPSKRFRVQWSWVNKGVAPCYPGGFPALTLKDTQGGIVSVLVDESLNMRDLKVGPPGKSPVRRHESHFIVGLYAPATRPGPYDLFISVGARDGTPTIALPLTGDDGQRRYRIGAITLSNGSGATGCPLNR